MGTFQTTPAAPARPMRRANTNRPPPPHPPSRLAHRALLLLGTLLLTTCGDGTTTPPTPPPVPTTITISPSSVTFHSLGDTEQLTATVLDQNGRVMTGASVNWATSDATVATVSPTGLVTAIQNGSASVTATSGAASSSASVAVAQRVASVRVAPLETTLESLGDTLRLLAEGLDANGNPVGDADFTWSSSDDSVATVDTDGLVTAVQNGAATVTATAGEFTATTSLIVAQQPANILVTPEASTLFSLGDTLRLSAKALDARGNPITEAALAWSSDDESVATVDSTGLVTAVRSGGVEIAAAAGDVDGSAAITVAQLAVEVRMSPSAVTLRAIGDTVRLRAEALDANGNLVVDAYYTWSSNNLFVATVDSIGLVTATGSGSAAIRARAGGAGGNHIGTATISVLLEVAEVRVSPLTASLPAIGDVVRLTAVAYGADGRVVPGVSFSWTSSDELVATVDSDGLVTSHAPGLATVTASSGEHSAAASIIVGETLPFVALVADTAIRSGGAFDVAIVLDMRQVPHTAGAVAVEISFDPTLVQFDPDTDPTAQHYWSAVYADDYVHIVVSAPSGLQARSTLAALPFRANGAGGSQATLDIRVIQAIAAGSYADISNLLAAKGQRVRIQP